MTNPLVEIKAKCEQYWDENRINSVEIHAILDFIHTRTRRAMEDIERLKYVEEENSWGAELHCHDEHEIERWEAERITFHIDAEEVTAKVFSAKFQSMQVEIERLEAAGEKVTYAYEHSVLDSAGHLVEIERLEQEFGNLMARINGDGGHKAAEFKTTREAGEHCETVFMDLVVKVERLNGELDSQRRITGEALHQKNAKIERRNVDHAQTRAEGMEAAVKAVKETDLKDCYPGEDLTIGAWNDCREQIAISIVAAIRAAAKEQA